MNQDGTFNAVLWRDFSERGIHEMAVKTKALTRAYYGRDARYAYWNGFSTDGRQGHKEAQAHPEDFDGILAGAPAFNWTKFILGRLDISSTGAAGAAATSRPICVYPQEATYTAGDPKSRCKAIPALDADDPRLHDAWSCLHRSRHMSCFSR